ncbi:MAG: hypothetical protein KDK41_17085 [Leptospiraceae bacterium]|nr:hypothetical protein [Leptospiraceae bacterium]
MKIFKRNEDQYTFFSRLVFFLFISILANYCNYQNNIPEQKLDFGYTSIESLIIETFRVVKEQDEKTFDYIRLQDKEFKKLVYPYLPEAKQGITPVDYWSWLVPDFIKGKKFLFEKMKSDIELVSIGKPKKILQFGPIKLHRNIPVTLGRPDGRGGYKDTAVYDNIFTAIVEIDGLYRLFNMTVD